MSAEIDAYVFDAYGTLFDVHSAVRRHARELGLQSQHFSEIWRAKQLEYTWVRALMGKYCDFWQLTSDALDYAFAVSAPDRRAMRLLLLESYRRPEAYPEVRGVLERLKASGARLAVLSNGSPEMLAAAAESARILELLDEIISVDAIKSYKTDPRVYALVEKKLGVASPAVFFQSSNRWDVAGAVAYGLQAVWINRTDQPDEYGDLPPVAVMSSLRGLLEGPGLNF